VGKVIMLFTGRTISKQFVPKKHKCFGIKFTNPVDMTGYTYNMRIYLGKDRQNTTQMITATHKTVRSLARRVGRVSHKFYEGNFVSSPGLFDDLHTRSTKCCGTVR
jgi:hypothetical protein